MTSCYRIEILKVILSLVSEEESNNSIFKTNLREDKHYFLILKAFNDSYYDVQTYCASIIKSLDIEQTIKEKIFSFMNYVVCPPEHRDFDVYCDLSSEFNAFHSPVFKNEVKNIFEHSEEMKEQVNLSTFGKFPKLRSNESAMIPGLSKKITVNRRESKYLKNLKAGFADEPSSACVIGNKRKEQDTSVMSEDVSFDEFNVASPEYINNKIGSIKKHMEEKTKNTDISVEESKSDEYDDDAVSRYLFKISKESPVMPDDNKIEVNQHRKSGKSNSPNRKSKSNLRASRYKDSTNIPLESSLSSDDN